MRILLLLCLAGVTVALPVGPYIPGAYRPPAPAYAPAPYNETPVSYSIAVPDGRIQTVTYSVDKNGDVVSNFTDFRSPDFTFT
jgi:hypothetical protein